MNYDEMKMNIKKLTMAANEKLKDVPEEKGYLRSAIKQQIENLDKLPTKYEQMEYRLVFMGKQGCGKTTTITNLCGLYRDDLNDITKKNKIDKVSLLPTGSGGTTAAETIEIHQTEGSGSYFIVTCCSRSELQTRVSAYIDERYTGLLNVYKKEHEFDTKENLYKEKQGQENLPPEIKRCIRNMCKKGLNSRLGEKDDEIRNWGGDDIFDKLNSNTEPFETFIDCAINNQNEKDKIFESGEINEEVVEQLAGFVLKLMEPFSELVSDSNDDLELEIRAKADENIKDFIQDTAKRLNDGTYEVDENKIPIVKRMRLYIDKNDIDMKLHSDDGNISITSVVDTRGFVPGEHGDGEREDYKSYFEDPGSICILEEKYPDTSGGQLVTISEILKYNMKMHYDIGLNAIMINWRTSEPSNNLDNQSEDEKANPDEIVLAEKRKKQVSEYIKKEGMHFEPVNVLMYNPITAYEYNQSSIITGYDEKKDNCARNDMIEKIIDLVKKERARLLEKIENNYSLLEKFIKFGDISIRDESIAIIEELQRESEEWMSRLNYDLKTYPFNKYYEEYLKSFHSRAYKALARNKGEYKSTTCYPNLISLFSVAVPLARFWGNRFSFVCNNLEKKYQEIRDKCHGAYDENDVLPLLENYYYNMIDSISKAIEERLRDDYKNMLKDDGMFGELSEVWKITQGDSGTGVNARIKDAFLETVKKREMPGLTPDFPSFCEKEQGIIEKEITKIINDSFGQDE